MPTTHGTRHSTAAKRPLKVATTCWAATALPKIVLPRRRLRLSQVTRALPLVRQALRSSRFQRPRASGRLNRHGWAASACIKHPPTCRSTGRRARLRAQVREDLLDHRLFRDRGNDLQLAATVRAVLHVEAKHAVNAGAVRVINSPAPDQPHASSRNWPGV